MEKKTKKKSKKIFYRSGVRKNSTPTGRFEEESSYEGVNEEGRSLCKGRSEAESSVEGSERKRLADDRGRGPRLVQVQERQKRQTEFQRKRKACDRANEVQRISKVRTGT